MSNDKIIIESLKDELEVCNTEKNTLIQENNMLKRSLTDIVEKLRVCNSIPRNTNTDIGRVSESEATSQTSREERERISRARERVAAREAQFERESEEREAQFKRDSEEREEAAQAERERVARAERERVARARERVAAREAQFERESEEREAQFKREEAARALQRLAESREARIPEIVIQAQKAQEITATQD